MPLITSPLSLAPTAAPGKADRRLYLGREAADPSSPYLGSYGVRAVFAAQQVWQRPVCAGRRLIRDGALVMAIVWVQIHSSQDRYNLGKITYVPDLGLSLTININISPDIIVFINKTI